MINETYSLLLNNTKSSIIDINLDSERSLKYYKIIQPISNHSITINNQIYNNYYEYGKITRVNYMVQIILIFLMKLKLLKNI